MSDPEQWYLKCDAWTSSIVIREFVRNTSSWSTPSHTESETLGKNPATHVSRSDLDISDALKFENHCKDLGKSYYLLPA